MQVIATVPVGTEADVHDADGLAFEDLFMHPPLELLGLVDANQPAAGFVGGQGVDDHQRKTRPDVDEGQGRNGEGLHIRGRFRDPDEEAAE